MYIVVVYQSLPLGSTFYVYLIIISGRARVNKKQKTVYFTDIYLRY